MTTYHSSRTTSHGKLSTSSKWLPAMSTMPTHNDKANQLMANTNECIRLGKNETVHRFSTKLTVGKSTRTLFKGEVVNIP